MRPLAIGLALLLPTIAGADIDGGRPVAPPRRPTPYAGIALAAVAGVHLVIGATLVGVSDRSASSDRSHDADAGYAMLAVAGAAAVVDVALWVRWARRPRIGVAR